MTERFPNQWLLDASREAMHRSAELLKRARLRRSRPGDIEAVMVRTCLAVSDEEKERIAIEVEHLLPDEAQAEYDRRVRELEEGENK